MGMAQYCYGCGLALSVELYIALGGGQYNCGGFWCCGKRSQLWVWLNTVLGDSILLYYIILLWVEFNTIVGGSWLNTVVGVKQL